MPLTALLPPTAQAETPQAETPQAETPQAETGRPAQDYLLSPPIQAMLAAREAADDTALRPQIVGGSNVSSTLFRNQFRWMVSLQLDGFGHLCGATMLRPRMAVTAAHCVIGRRANQLSVLQGTRLLSSGGNRARVEGFVIEPNYVRTTLDRDIAILRLSERLPGPRVSLANNAQTATLAAPGRNGTILGWGALSEGGPGPDILQRAVVPFVSLSACQSIYASATVRMVCAGLPEGGRDTCQGDSGGPIVARDASGTWQQIGITSFGEGCARPNRPGVYARVASFGSFVADAIGRQGAACYDPSWPAHFRTPDRFDCHTHVGFIDSSTGPVRIGFPIRLAETRYTELFINTNGNVTFGAPHIGFNPGPLDEVGVPIIAPFWDDGDTRFAGMIRYGRALIDGQRAFMVIWQQMPAFGGPPSQGNTFQLVLMEPDRTRRWTDIEFNYASITWNKFGAYVGFAVADDGPVRTRGGSGASTSFVNGARNELRSISNSGVPGRLSWQLRGGRRVR